MKTTNYAGIDYARGTGTNKNLETGIAFGVIPSREVAEAFEDIMQHGQDLDHAAYIGEVKAKLSNALSDYFSDYQHESGKPSRLDNAVQEAFDAIEDSLNDQYEGTGDCTRYLYSRDGYKIETASDGDMFILESPYFTYAQFCSPCAPGACYLLNPLETPAEANKCYCLGADWFEDGKAPYPIYSVATGEQQAAA